jgi:hypothetical protein
MNSLEELKQWEIDLAEDRYQWWAQVRAVINLGLCERQVISLHAEQLLAPQNVLYLLGLHIDIY